MVNWESDRLDLSNLRFTHIRSAFDQHPCYIQVTPHASPEEGGAAIWVEGSDKVSVGFKEFRDHC